MQKSNKKEPEQINDVYLNCDENEAVFGLNCEGCGKQIKRLPCRMIQVEDPEDWVYFHTGCLKKFKEKHTRKG